MMHTDANAEDGTALVALAEKWWHPAEELLGTLPGRGGGPSLTYLGHADTTRALIEADPFWTWEPMGREESGAPLVERDDKGNPVGLWIYLSVCGVTRPAYGSCQAGKAEAIKELIGDAIRNGAMRFGVAGGLWSKADRSAHLVTEAQRRDLAKLAGERGVSAEKAAEILEQVAGVTDSAHLPSSKLDDVRQAFRMFDPVAEVAREFDAEVV